MNLEIIDQPLRLAIHGFSGVALDKDYAGTAFKLMDKMWPIVKSNKLAHKGLNIWIYEPNDRVFAGVELESPPIDNKGLERKSITLTKYAYFKHVGPYHLIKQVGRAMDEELTKMKLKRTAPYIEIYGHWTNDETKLETELLMCVE